MIQFFKGKTEFRRNVMVLMTGTTIAKAVSIAAVPILTRLYEPADFGLFGFFIACATLLSAIASARYELAIMQARSTVDADNLVFGTLVLATGFSVLILVAITIWHRALVSALDIAGIGLWLYVLPVSVFLLASYQALSHWLNRRKEYRRMGGNRVLQATLAAGGNIGFGLAKVGVGGLIVGQLIAQLVTTSLLFRTFWQRCSAIRKLRIIALFRRYRAYAKYDLPASSMNNLAQQAPTLSFAPLFGAVSAGHYFLIQRIFLVPITLASTSIGSVFRQAATEQYRKVGNFKRAFWSVFLKLLIIALPATVVFMLVAEDLFAVVFGPDWRIAGKYARILAPMFMLKFVVSPLTFAFYIRNRLHLNTIGQAAYLLSVTIAILSGVLRQDFELAIYLLSILSSLVYVFYFLVSMRLAA